MYFRSHSNSSAEGISKLLITCYHRTHKQINSVINFSIKILNCEYYASPEKTNSDSKELCNYRPVSNLPSLDKTTELYDETGWLKLEERRGNSKFSFMYKVVHETATDYLVEILQYTVNSRQLRNYGNYKQCSARTEKFRKSFLPDCVRK